MILKLSLRKKFYFKLTSFYFKINFMKIPFEALKCPEGLDLAISHFYFLLYPLFRPVNF